MFRSIFRSVARSSIPHFVCPSVCRFSFISHILRGWANSWKYVATQNIMYGHMIWRGLPSPPLPSSHLHSLRLTKCSQHVHDKFTHCSQHVHDMFKTFSQHIHDMFTTCSPHAHLYSLHVHHMLRMFTTDYPLRSYGR